jgi:7-cyano-7-deazaguanine reductase
MKADKKPFDLGGYKGKQETIRSLVIKPRLRTIENKYEDKDYLVELRTDEFTSICPKTRLPDFAEVIIQYKPGKSLAEEKSLKLYLQAYRHLPIFQEHAANKILEDFVKAVKPRWARITTLWHPRGGISAKIEAEYPRPSLPQ